MKPKKKSNVPISRPFGAKFKNVNTDQVFLVAAFVM